VIGEGAMDLIKARCTEIESGGRMIDAILTNTLLPELSRQVLNRPTRPAGGPAERVRVGLRVGDWVKQSTWWARANGA
jgi:type VI secretion system protein VasG